MTNSNFTRRWGHHAPYIICAILFTVIGLVKVSLPTYLILGIGVFLVGLLLVSWQLMRRHDRQLCEYCMRAMPLDAGQTAHKNRFFLALAHKPIKMIVSYLGLLLIVDGVMMGWGNNWMYVVWIIAHIPILAFMYAHMAHARLAPWCPSCRERGIEKRTEGKVLA